MAPKQKSVMEAFPAQPDNLPDHQVVLMLNRAISVLVKTSNLIRDTKPSRATKDQIRRELAGVQADLEIIGLGLDSRRR